MLVAIGSWLVFSAFRKKDDLITVQTEKAGRRDLTETVIASGKIQPVIQVVISPEVAGEITELPVEEGDKVKKGQLLVQIKPDNYKASRDSAEANYQFALGNHEQNKAELERAEDEFKRKEALFAAKLITPSEHIQFKTALQLATLRLANSERFANQARFALVRAEDDLAKTRIVAPIDGTVIKLKSQLGERVLGTSFNMGTEMMTIAQLDDMEARVDIGEIDVVLIDVNQAARIEVDAFKDRKFNGSVTAIANAVKGLSTGLGSSDRGGGSSQSQEAPKFEVRIRISDKENFRPGMSVTAEIETRSRKDALSVPIQSVTRRLPAGAAKPDSEKKEKDDAPRSRPRKNKSSDAVKPVDVVFVLEGDHVKMVPVTTGISDSDYYEIVSGLTEGQEVISGGYKAISKDLEDGKKVTVGAEPKKPPGK